MCDPRTIPGLPEQLREIAKKLCSYDFHIRRDSAQVWSLAFPPGHRSGVGEVGFHDWDLATGLLRVLREEETRRGVLHRYEQFDSRWGSIVYGNSPGDTTIAQAGCGPTSLAIVLQYLMNNGSRTSNATYAVTPPTAARYAATHGRVSGHGTAGDPMIRDLKKVWPEFDGSKVTLEEAVGLLEEGRLVIFLCKRCRGWNSAPSICKKGRWIPDPPPISYGGHYMVLAGVEGPRGNELFYVVDPGRSANRMMRFINRRELRHNNGFWWVYLQGEPLTRQCQQG
jgi:hypothetical protein